MRKVVWGIAASLLSLVVAHERAEAAPAWCSGLQKPSSSASVQEALTDPDPGDALFALVYVTCFPEDDAAKRMREIDASRARWSKKLDLTEADWADIGQWSQEQQSTRNNTDIKLDHEKKYALSTMGPLDQFAAIVAGLPNSTNFFSEYTYVTDAFGPKLTETGRFGYILQACLRTNSDATIVEWATCLPDLALLDRKKLAAEIRADNSRRPFDKVIVRLQLAKLDENVKQMGAEWKKAKEKDPAYAKMFDIAQATRKEWDGVWKSETAALDLMLAMDDVRQTKSRKLKDGCEAKTWPAVQAAIGKVDAKRFEGFSLDIADSWLQPAMGVVASSPGGWLALAAYHTCTADQGEKDALSSTIGSVLSFLPGYRGPRTATVTAIRNAGLQLDDASAQIEIPSIDYRSRFAGMAARAHYGTVGKVTVKGDKAEVAFKPKMEKQEQCAQSKSTNRISMISQSGQVYYESVCLKWKGVVVDRSPDPESVDKRYVEGLKPGMNVLVGPGIVVAAWQKGKKSPALVAGVPVK